MDSISFFFDWEIRFITFLQSLYGDVLSYLSDFFSFFGEEIALIGIVGFLYWCYDKEKGKFIATNFLFALIVSPLVKNIAIRKRPYMCTKSIKCYKPINPNADIFSIQEQGYSMPSAHAANTSSVLGSIMTVYKRRWITVVSLIGIVLIGLSRIIVGMHFPTDILVGWAIGALSVIIVSFLQKKIKRRLILTAFFVLLGLPGWFYCKSSDFFTSYGIMIGISFAFYFEEKFVNFKECKGVFMCALRLLGGLISFLLINTLIKLPFSDEFLSSTEYSAYIVRCIRYMLSTFVAIGVYPLAFKYFDRIKKGKSNE